MLGVPTALKPGEIESPEKLSQSRSGRRGGKTFTRRPESRIASRDISGIASVKGADKLEGPY